MQCVICHGSEIETKKVNEEVRIENDVVFIPVEVLVCKTCGAHALIIYIVPQHSSVHDEITPCTGALPKDKDKMQLRSLRRLNCCVAYAELVAPGICIGRAERCLDLQTPHRTRVVSDNKDVIAFVDFWHGYVIASQAEFAHDG